jgi:hypothetical protein
LIWLIEAKRERDQFLLTISETAFVLPRNSSSRESGTFSQEAASSPALPQSTLHSSIFVVGTGKILGLGDPRQLLLYPTQAYSEF